MPTNDSRHNSAPSRDVRRVPPQVEAREYRVFDQRRSCFSRKEAARLVKVMSIEVQK